ncbi:MFS-1 domain protein [Rhizoctonia solani 123E]|uniref:MFS-1 domain protein n=1 Tax=Rhizoctonia solani 123E TaxID=1423351 RepID=A0A074RYG3_9AGAM|nr:MFS-1 domain protein [Rhizoctonia solani 123E]
MSQTATCEIELLDTLPHLETGTPFDRAKSLYAQTPDDATRSSHTLAISLQPNEISGTRIGKIFIEDKVLYLAGACMGAFAVGLNDTATGANLPSFQAHYHLSYETV